MGESRVHKSFLNAKVNLVFYFITLFVSFFSRKVFLDCLGADFMGLAGTVGNLLSFLNMAELGIGSSIGYVLYKPIFEKDREKISDVISVLGYLYRIVGTIILCSGIILSFFLPLIFKDVSIDISVIYFVYYSFLIGTLFGYFVNYRYTLFGADQRNYLVTAYLQTANIIKTLIQMGLAYYTKNYYLWAIIELSFGILYCFILNWKTNQVYPWLKTSYRTGKLKRKEYDIILVKARQLFVHQIGSLGRYKVLPFLIYAYSSLSAVAYYANYTLIVDKVNAILNNVLNSTGAGVGNMIAEGDKDKIQRVYWELMALRYFLAGILLFGLYNLLEPFIYIWLGEEYVMDRIVLLMILVNLFVMQVRGTNDQFIHGYGLFADTWAPVVTFILTVGVAILGGIKFGLPGVLSGDAFTALLIIYTWKPIYLYRCGFRLSIRKYWFGIFKYLLVLAVSWILASWLLIFVPINPYQGYIKWGLFACISELIFIIILGLLAYIFWQGFRDIFSRLILKKWK